MVVYKNVWEKILMTIAYMNRKNTNCTTAVLN